MEKENTKENLKTGKFNIKVQKVIVLLLIAIALFVMPLIFAKKESIKIAIQGYQERRALAENLEGWELSTIMYDSEVNGGLTGITIDNWDATSYMEYRTITMQLNIRNTSVNTTYAPGEIQIRIDNLGIITAANNGTSNITQANNVSADLSTVSNKEYEFSYRYDSASNTYIFTNNNEIEANSNFETTIQLAYLLYAVDCKNNSNIEISANINDVLYSTNSLNFNFTSTERTISTETKRAQKLNSYDGLGENAEDYIWVKYNDSIYKGGAGVRGKVSDSYIIENVPDGGKLLNYNLVEIEPDEHGIYKYITGGNSSSNTILGSKSTTYGGVNPTYYIGYPRSEYENMIITSTTEWYGKVYESTNYMGTEEKLLGSKSIEVNLSEFEIEIPNPYSISKDQWYSYTLSYNKMINHNIKEYQTYEIAPKVYYTGEKYNLVIGDDILYITGNNGIRKLQDNEYYFTFVKITPSSIRNGNNVNIQLNKYETKLFVRYRGEEEYLQYGDSFILSNTKTITFLDDEKVEGWYFEIYDLEESFIRYNSDSFLTRICLEPNAIAEEGKLYNFDYVRVYSYENNTLLSEATYDKYNTVAKENGIPEDDLIKYGTYIIRGCSTRDYGKDKVNIEISSSGTTESVNDENYFYKNIKWYTSTRVHYSTGVEEFNGYRIYFLFPENFELNCTKEELIDNITIFGSSNWNLVYKSDGTAFSNANEWIVFLKDHMSVNVNTSYKNTGKLMVELVADFSDSPLNTYQLGNLYGPDYLYHCYYNIPVKIPYENYFTYGSSFMAEAYVMLLNDEENGYGSYYNYRDINDIDDDGLTTDNYISKASGTHTLVPAISSYQEVNKSVWTETSGNHWVTDVIGVKYNSTYKYKMRVRTGINAIKNLVIYDVLELEGGWQGTFAGVDTEFTNGQGFNPTVYYALSDSVGTLTENPDDWFLYDEATTDKTRVRAVAFDYGDAVIPSGSLTYVIVEMLSPESVDDTDLANNKCYTTWTAIDSMGNEIEEVTGIDSNVALVAIPDSVQNIEVEKKWEDNNDEYGVRPNSINLRLYQNGIEYRTKVLTEADDWKGVFEDIPVCDDDGYNYEYTIIEDNINLYDSNVQRADYEDNNGITQKKFIVTNVVKDDLLETDYEVNKVWDDNSNARGNRPEDLTVNLLQDNVVIDSAILSESNGWYYKFGNLPRWKNNTTEYNYKVEEVEDIHYSTLYDEKSVSVNGMKIKFSSSCKTESVNYDYVEIYYKLNNSIYKIGKWGGDNLAGREVVVPTNDFYLYWRTDSSNHDYYGFSLDYIKMINYDGEIIGTNATLPNYSIIEVDENDYPESEHTYQDNVNMLWHYTGSNGIIKSVDITNTYKLIPATVLVHHYIKNTTNSLVPDVTLNGYVWDSYQTVPSDSIPTYYQLVETPSNATGNYTQEQKVVTYEYELKDYGYTVEYYYDGVIDNSKTEHLSATYGNTINSHTNNIIDGYRYVNESGIPLVITDNEATNNIKVYYEKRTDLNYTIYYKEQGTENTLLTAKTVNNQTFADVITETAPDISGYNKVNPTSVDVEITTGVNEHTFYYTKRTDLSYTVNYLEQGTNNVLLTAKTVNNQTYLSEVTETAPDISGYNKVNPTSQTITIDVTENVINFYYTKRTDLSYIVNYLEQTTNNVLLTAKTVSNQRYLSEITETAPDIDGYNKVDPTSQTITIDVTGNVINFYYTKRTDLGYTIYYKEQGTENTLLTAKNVNNQRYLDIITEIAPDISGYNKVDPISVDIEITTGVNEHTFYYTKRTDLSYTVNYLEQTTNNVLLTAKVVNNQRYLSEITEISPDISGYNKVNPTSQTITIEVTGNVINFYYTKRTDLSYTVNYLEQGTNTVLSTAKTVGNQTYLSEVTETAVDVNGYDKVEPISQTITIEVTGNVINFYYTKRTDLGYTIYYKEQGTENTLLTAKTVNNQTFADVITETAADIDGYNKVDPISVDIEIRTGVNEHTFYYTKRTDLSYTVYYKEQGTENTLLTAKTVNNQTFADVITETAPDISGYNKVEPITVDIEITTGTNEHTFYYTKKTDLSYTVNYLEQGTENTLLTAKTVNNQTFADVITETAADIDGYNKVDPTSQTITIDVIDNIINFYYTKRTDLSYTIYYKEQGTENRLLTAKAVNNQTFADVITETAPDISGYNKVNPTTVDVEITTGVNEHTFYYTKRTDLSYVVNYLEQGTNNVLVTAKTVENQTYLSEVTEVAVDINGYDKVEPVSQTITIEVTGNVINFYYTKRTDLSYTVNYLEQGTDNVLVTAKTVGNQTYLSEVTEVAVDINGYDKVDPTSQTITIEVTGNVINFYYTKRTDLSYTIYYKEQGTENTLLTAKSVNNQTFADIITEVAPDISGYNKVDPISVDIEITTGVNEHTFYYTKRTDLLYVVNYLEQGTNNVLVTAKTVENQTYLSEVTEVAVDINGYDKVEPISQTITIEVTGNVIDFYYTKRTDLGYTIYYKEQGTENVLSTTKEVDNQTFADVITETAIDISGYDKVDPTTVDIEITTGVNEHTFYYTKRTDLSYTVNYLEQGTNKVLSGQKVEGNQIYLSEITETAIDVIGYNKVDPTSITITIGADDNIINFYYTKRTDLSYTVNYLEKDTNDVLHPAETINNQTFESVINSLDEVIEITGYDYNYADPDNLTISVDEANNVINLYYIKGTFNYTVEYYYEGVIDNSKTVTLPATYFDLIETYEDKVIDNYEFKRVSNLPLRISADSEQNVIRVYYEKKYYKYTVKYFFEGVEDVTQREEYTAKYETVINNFVEKNYDGMVLDKTVNLPLTITENEDENIIEAYYVMKPAQVIVRYVYISDRAPYIIEMDEREIIEGRIGDSYDATPYIKEYQNYLYTESTPNITGVMRESPIYVVHYYVRLSSVLVKYFDMETGELLDSEELFGGVGEDLVIEPKEIEGYVLIEGPENNTVEIEHNQTEVYYYYGKAKYNYSIEYYYNDVIDETKTEIKTANAGTIIDLYEDKAYDYYMFDKVENCPLTVSAISEDNIIRVYYIRKDAKVIVNHIDNKTGEILEKEEIEGFVGQSYTSKEKDLEGYVLVKKPESETVIMTESTIEMNYYYEKVSAGVIEKHIDLIDGRVLEDKSYSGIIGDTYTTEVKDFEGYDIAKNKDIYNEEELIEKDLDPDSDYIPENFEGVMTDTLIEVKYYYLRKMTVKVEYVDYVSGKILKEKIETDTLEGEEDFSEVDSTVIIEGHEGDKYTSEIKIFEGYVLIKNSDYYNEAEIRNKNLEPNDDYIPENANGIMKIEVASDKDNPMILVRYYYGIRTEVIEQHIDYRTNEILEEAIYKGYVGELYSIKPKKIKNYDLATNKELYTEEEIKEKGLNPENSYMPENAEGVMTKESIEVKYYYVMKAKVIIGFVEKETNAALEPYIVINGHVGDEYYSNQIEIPEYEFVSVDGEPNGIMQEEPVMVTYYYTKIKEPEKEEPEPEQKQEEYKPEPSQEVINNSSQVIIINNNTVIIQNVEEPETTVIKEEKNEEKTQEKTVEVLQEETKTLVTTPATGDNIKTSVIKIIFVLIANMIQIVVSHRGKKIYK